MTEIHIEDVDKIETLKADDRGRVSLGKEYAEREVKIVVVDTDS